MKRGFASLAAIMAIALMVPLSGHAEPRGVECTGASADGVCSVEFLLEGEKFVSILGTHGNVHSVGDTSSVTVQWFDANEALAAQYDCSGPGLPTPADEQSLLCTETVAADSYAAGLQTLVVTLNEASCAPDCEFHGGIVFGDPGEDLI